MTEYAADRRIDEIVESRLEVRADYENWVADMDSTEPSGLLGSVQR